MDPTAPRSIAKQQYATVRRSLTAFEERVVARYWDEGTLVRDSFERFLGSLDHLAEWLLDGGEEQAEAQADEQPAPAAEQAAPAAAAPAAAVEVTFTLPAEVRADSVALCGEFNQWAVDSIPLERGSDGTWRATVPLEPGRSYRYRYLLDGERWENDPQADQYVPNPYGSVDSVVIVESS